MNSRRINKTAKAMRYAEEPERLQFTQFEAVFQGENDTTHTITFNNVKAGVLASRFGIGQPE